MSDKDLIINSTVDYLGDVSSNLIGFNLNIATKSILKVGINNMINKNPYKAICDFMFDENDNLPNSKDFFDAAKDLISQKPIVIKGIKFNHKDVEEIERAFNNAR